MKEKSLNSFIAKLTIATIIKVIETNKDKDYLTYVIIALNMLGIFFLLIMSIFLFRSIIRAKLMYDKTQNTPSDYAILVRNIPREKSEKEIKEMVDEVFSVLGGEVVQVNMCCDISLIVKLQNQLKKCNYEIGLCEIHEARVKKNSKEEATVDKPFVREGFFRRKRVLEREEIQAQIKTIQDQLDKECADFKDEFIGAAIIVLKN